jgi:hypothetical protein
VLATRLPLAPALLLRSLGFCRFTEAGLKLRQFGLPLLDLEELSFYSERDGIVLSVLSNKCGALQARQLLRPSSPSNSGRDLTNEADAYGMGTSGAAHFFIRRRPDGTSAGAVDVLSLPGFEPVPFSLAGLGGEIASAGLLPSIKTLELCHAPVNP